jgi:hypothetical protein
MRRLVLALAGSILLIVGPIVAYAAPKTQARLTISAQGAAMNFVTMGFNPGAFGLGDGAFRTFTLKPGSYVVVQAPPVIGYDLQVVCSDGGGPAVSLQAGEQLTCTFIATPAQEPV